MYTACLFGALIIVMGEAGGPDGTSVRETGFEQRILLRKLQNIQRNDVTAEIVTWNEILADVLVKNLNIFSKNEDATVLEKPKNIATKCFSKVLEVYKSIYDKFISDKTIQHDAKTTTEANPKSEVEVIKTVMKRDNCDDCDNFIPDTGIDEVKCPKGFVKNEAGECQDAAYSKLILAIPYHCPIGYKRDRLGFCRIVF